MQIKEVSKKTGLSIKTIRFYTERDLVDPKKEERNGRTYKDFSQRDLDRLQMIAVLRKCLFSIEQIKTMIDHPELTPDVFMEYRDELLTQAERLTLLAEKAVTMDPDSLNSPEVLARKLSHTASPLPLPTWDSAPHFGKLDPETPEERHQAFLLWQKRYKYRYLRWILPAVILFMLLTTVTLVQAGMNVNSNLDVFMDRKEELRSAVWEFDFDRYDPAKEPLEIREVYALYDFDGNLIQYYNDPGNQENLKDPTAAQIVEDVINDLYYDHLIFRDETLDRKLSEWVSTRNLSPDGDHQLIKSNIFSQTLAFVFPIEVQGETYYLAYYSHSAPLFEVFFKYTGIFYLAALFAFGVIFALRTTKGYGLQVRVMRQYTGRGWSDAVFHIDEKTGKGTMLTKQWGGMSNLMQSDYRDET